MKKKIKLLLAALFLLFSLSVFPSSASAVKPTQPMFSIESGTYSKPQSVILQPDDEFTVYYTTDGSKPDDNDILYNGEKIQINCNTTIRTASYYEGEAVEYNKLVVKIKTSKPSASVKSGTFSDSINVTLSCADEKAVIYYTTDGTTPTKKSAKYKKDIKITESTTLKFIAIEKGKKKSSVVTEKYIIETKTNAYSDDKKQAMFNLVNQARAEYGLDPLEELPLLSQIAQQRAEECSVYYSHYRADGTKWDYLLSLNGLKRSVRAENLAYYYSSARQAFNCWMNDSFHRGNILNPDAKYIGIGYYYNDYNYYWCQLFIGE